jgi:hypothetical protein
MLLEGSASFPQLVPVVAVTTTTVIDHEPAVQPFSTQDEEDERLGRPSPKLTSAAPILEEPVPIEPEGPSAFEQAKTYVSDSMDSLGRNITAFRESIPPLPSLPELPDWREWFKSAPEPEGRQQPTRTFTAWAPSETTEEEDERWNFYSSVSFGDCIEILWDDCYCTEIVGRLHTS